MKRKYLAFDIETTKAQRTNERDWKSARPLGLSCAATLLSDADEPMLWHGGKKCRRPKNRMSQQEAMKLVDFLSTNFKRGYTIVTWNGVGFDFDVLGEESGMLEECRRLALDHVDMMFHVLCRLGHGVSLDSAARGMGLGRKPDGISGAIAPILWTEGRRKEVLKYVAHDARLTLELAENCEACGFLRWVTRRGRKREMSLRDGWLVVRAAEKLPEPDTSWMRNQWSRSRFTAWLR